ncbi:Ribonuclease P/MRP protein subunit [Phytophthora cactorum]|nr:Ribonuclease P/MRP protein subunit [Phytophthora cactorum]
MVRLKTRYLLAVKKEDITVLIRESITKSYGDFGSVCPSTRSKVGTERHRSMIHDADFRCCSAVLQHADRLAAIRCAREMCKMVETSLVFVTDVHNQDVSLRVARVCGTSHLSAY